MKVSNKEFLTITAVQCFFNTAEGRQFSTLRRNELSSIGDFEDFHHDFFNFKTPWIEYPG